MFSFSSKSFQSQKQIPPYYQLEVSGLNSRINNDLSDFVYSDYIERQVERFSRQWGLRGVSIAVIKDERLVYAQGFGDANEKGDRVQPGNIFRVASVSKLLTAVAVMKLVEEGRMNLEDQVFGSDGIIKDSIFQAVRDKRIYKITVRDLLAHAGGWSQRYGDPAFNSLTIAKRVGDEGPATIETFYKYIASRKLHFYPGSMVSYSNMGYMFLGEVVAKVAGKSYEDYLQENILIPNGIVDMHIGRTYEKDRRENEVSYFEAEGAMEIQEANGSGEMVVKSNGGNPIELLGAAGGWTCSAIELARLLTYIDGFNQVQDILSAESISEMTNNTYAKGPLGWKRSFNNGSWIRTGSMAGTSAMVKRSSDGLNWVFISNTSSWKGSLLSSDINAFMHKICTKVKEWPEQDLFNYYPIHTLPVASSIQDFNHF